MDKESAYLLQRIDCNCNNCGFMQRDFEKYQYWHDWHKAIELADFEKRKAKAIEDASAIEDPIQREPMLRKANKMRFLFSKDKLIQYGNCMKFNKPVSFLPDTCQIETQKCFIHRKDYVHLQ